MKRSTKENQTRDLTYLAIYFAVGFGPISALALSIFGLWTLTVGALCLTLPLGILGICLAKKNPKAGRIAATGFYYGLLAVFIYDLSRWTLSAYFGLNDFIPSIGGWLLATNEPNWIVGYLWRYIGNGGGMGIAFATIAAFYQNRKRLMSFTVNYWVLGILYGIGIWMCLIITLVTSARGQEMMFTLNTQYVLVTFIGHVVYGAVLGVLMEHRYSPARVNMENYMRYVAQS